MGLLVELPVILQLLKLSAICTLLTVHGSTGSGLLAPLAAPPLMSAPSSRTKGLVPSLSPSTPMEPTPHDAAPPPLTYQGNSPSLSPRFPLISPSTPTATPPSTIHADAPSVLPGAPREKTPAGNASISVPVAMPTNFPQIAPAISPSTPGTFPPTAHQRNASKSEAPVEEPIAPGTLPPFPGAQERNESNNKAPGAPGPSIHPSIPTTLPPTSHQRNESNYEAPMGAPVASAPPTRGDSPPIHLQRNALDDKAPAISPSLGTQAPVATPPGPTIQSSIPATLPSTSHQRNESNYEAPMVAPVAPPPPTTGDSPPIHHQRNVLDDKAPAISPSLSTQAPVATPPGPTIHSSIPATLPPTSHQRNESNYEAPMVAPVAPAPPTRGDSPPIHYQRNALDDKAPAISPSLGTQAPVATPPGPTIHSSIPATLPPTSHQRNESNYEAPMVAPVAPAPPTRGASPPIHHQRNASDDKAPAISPSSGAQAPVATPPGPTVHSSIPATLPPTSHQRNESNYEAPMVVPVAPAPPTRGDSPPIHHQRNASDDKAPAISPSPGAQERNESNKKAPGAPVATPPGPTIHPSVPATLPPTSRQRNESNYEAPMVAPVAPAPPTRGDSPPIHHQRNASDDKAPAISPSPGAQERNESNKKAPGAPVATPPGPTFHPSIPATQPPTSHQRNESNYEAPMVAPFAPAPPTRGDSPPIHHQRNAPDDKAPTISPTAPNPDVSPVSTPSIDWEKGGVPVAAPPNDIPKLLPPVNHSPTKAPSKHNAMRHSDDAPSPSLVSPRPPEDRGHLSPSLSPSTSFHKPHQARNRMSSPSPAYVIPLPPNQQGPAKPPAFIPSSGQRQNAPAHAPFDPGSLFSPSRHPFPPSMSHVSPAPLPFPMPVLSPKVSPSGPSPTSSKIPFLPPIQALPPPSPNEDCSSTVCTEPYTNTPSGSPCGCVWPMQVGLRLSVALYTFFPLVSQLAEEIATGVFMKQSQVRIIGANAASQQTEKTIVLIDLVPLEETFDNTTAFLTYQRFWHKQVAINPSLFGEYDVLYVRYPGLPPSPPSAPSINMIDGGPYSANGNNARAIKPLGVDLQNRQRKDGLSSGIIAVIVLSVLVAVVLCSALAWVLLCKHRDRALQPGSTQQSLPTTVLKPSGTAGSIIGSGISSTSLSFGSSIAPYTGSAKTFSTADIERATDNFNPLRVLGEGGFGRVYSGILEDGTKVAVKVLKREDQQGGREFLAEVEMLSRLHHRNLVKLIGICTEERNRCLVYELIPNGSVESHLHGVDNEAAPLDWDARVKIALGAARGLAYLHEDSSPRVIHRDFKSSNILLEHDFTPKVSDFGLARAAMDEENRHISTRVMGTFGYVAPEYAMTGHLLVKSDVYSYGVVLLELLTGRKPVEMSQPPGQENLVAWARPLLTSREGLEIIVDPSLGPDVPFDSIAKVAAIASMCVQPEVSHRPFMGEVVQALKLVCNECDEAKEVGSRTSSRENLSIDLDAGVGIGSRQLPDPLQSQYHMPHYDFGPDTEMGLSASDLFNASARLDRQASGSFRRYSSSGPLRTGRGKQFWQTIRGLTGGSVSEHGVTFKVQPGSH